MAAVAAFVVNAMAGLVALQEAEIGWPLAATRRLGLLTLLVGLGFAGRARRSDLAPRRVHEAAGDIQRPLHVDLIDSVDGV